MVYADLPLVKLEVPFRISVDRLHNPRPDCCHLRSLSLVYDCTKEIPTKGRSCYIQKCRLLVFRIKVKLCGICRKSCVTPCRNPWGKVPTKYCGRYQYYIRLVIFYYIHKQLSVDFRAVVLKLFIVKENYLVSTVVSGHFCQLIRMYSNNHTNHLVVKGWS